MDVQCSHCMTELVSVYPKTKSGILDNQHLAISKKVTFMTASYMNMSFSHDAGFHFEKQKRLILL